VKPEIAAVANDDAGGTGTNFDDECTGHDDAVADASRRS
jgi:hypothetical protein